MPAALRIELDAAARQDLEARFEQTRAAETRLRYQMVLLAADGRTAGQVAPLVRRSRATVERVLSRYLKEGPDGVPQRRRPGRRPVRPPEWEAELGRVIELDPHAVGVPSAVWTLGLLRDYLARVTGHRTSLETVRQALRRADYRCKRPVHTVKRKAQAQSEWPKKVSGWRRS
jgi:transposase